MATKKDKAREIVVNAGIDFVIDAQAGVVSDNLDEVITKTQDVLKTCSINLLDAEDSEVLKTRDLLASLKSHVSATIKDAKAVYDVPFTVLDAKAKALDIQIEQKANVVNAIATTIESTESCSKHADMYSYFCTQAKWLGPKYGPIVWAKHPSSWDKATNFAKVQGEIDNLLWVIRSAFRIIHSWHSPFEEMLLERYCETSDLKEALGVVYGYKEYLDSVAQVALTGGVSWDGWSTDILFFDEDVVTETFTVTGTQSELAAAKAAIAAMGAKLEAAPTNTLETIAQWLKKNGFNQEQIDEAVSDARALGYSLQQVKDLELNPEMSVSDIEGKFFFGLLGESN